MQTSALSIKPATSKKVVDIMDLRTSIKITPLGDIHLGAAACDELALREWVKVIANDPTHYTGFMGDMCDCIIPGDKRFDEREVADWLWLPGNRGRMVDAQFERLYDILSPIPPERVLWNIPGNHEMTIRSKHQRDMTLDLSRQLKVPYSSQECFIYLTFAYRKSKADLDSHKPGRNGLKLFVTHGSGGARMPGSKVNKIVGLTSFINADLTFMGHVHERAAIRTTQLDVNTTGNLVARERLSILTGTFLKTYEDGCSGYGARELYPPTSIGPVTITINPRTMQLGAHA